jgi:hypothetical protein
MKVFLLNIEDWDSKAVIARSKGSASVGRLLLEFSLFSANGKSSSFRDNHPA